MKRCPYCAEMIQDEAIYCRFCKHDLVENIDESVSKRTSNQDSEVDLNQSYEMKKMRMARMGQPHDSLSVAGWMDQLYQYIKLDYGDPPKELITFMVNQYYPTLDFWIENVGYETVRSGYLTGEELKLMIFELLHRAEVTGLVQYFIGVERGLNNLVGNSFSDYLIMAHSNLSHLLFTWALRLYEEHKISKSLFGEIENMLGVPLGEIGANIFRRGIRECKNIDREIVKKNKSPFFLVLRFAYGDFCTAENESREG